MESTTHPGSKSLSQCTTPRNNSYAQSEKQDLDLEKQVSSEGPTQSSTTNKSSSPFPETDLSRGIVGWEGQDDPNNPQNFPEGKKLALLGLISAFTFISPLASSMFAPAVGFMAVDFRETNETLLSFTVSVFLIGYTVRSNTLYTSALYLYLCFVVRPLFSRPPKRNLRPPHRLQQRKLVLRRLADRMRTRPEHRNRNNLPILRGDRRRGVHYPGRGRNRRPVPG